jgi:hypothetical protein
MTGGTALLADRLRFPSRLLWTVSLFSLLRPWSRPRRRTFFTPNWCLIVRNVDGLSVYWFELIVEAAPIRGHGRRGVKNWLAMISNSNVQSSA